jgi:hypothetical protein
MIYCEDCRVKEDLKKPLTYPYHKYSLQECEICHLKRFCYDYPALLTKKTYDSNEKLLDKAIQNEYRRMCEEFIIAYVKGTYAGATDHLETMNVKKAFIHKDGEVDWYGTYELRKRIREGYELKNRR